MDRRYQVFISSTFTDLIDERREVMQALLEMDCIPAGMELFPAGDTDQWTLIKGVIEQSDYYLVVLGGRYGSMTEEGISFTEMEYDYAVQLGIPVMGFVPADANAIPTGKTDRNEKAAEKLEAFQAKVQQKMTRDWKNAEDLGSKVTRGLIHLIKNNPRPGWVRGDNALSDETRVEMAELRTKIAQLEATEAKEVAAKATGATAGINSLYAHGSEKTQLIFVYRGRLKGKAVAAYYQLEWSWDEIMFVIGPHMIEEAHEDDLVKLMETQLRFDLRNEEGFEAPDGLTVSLEDDTWASVIVQLRALKAIQAGTKKRVASDNRKYWQLTPAGDEWVTELRAEKHEEPEADEDSTAEAAEAAEA